MKSLTDQLQIAYEEGKNDGLTIAGDTRQPSPRSGRQHPVPRYGVGGYEDHPYDDFGTYRGPTIPNPNPGQGFDWAGMPPDLNTPWLPGGQKTDGIPNITNPKLKKKLQEKKGIKGTDAELFPLAQGRDGLDQGTINKYRKMWQKHHNPNDPYTIPSDKLPAVQDIVIFERWPQAQISPTDTPRDLKIQDVIKKYGKDEKGNYKNPELLIQNLPRA